MNLHENPKVPADRLLEPLRKFAEKEASSGILLLFCTLVAMLWANSPWGHTYNAFWNAEFSLGFEHLKITEPLVLWINDGLMAVFFFVVGLEIKREILVGELSNPRQALLPIAAALGGMIVPALIYTAFNHSLPSRPGWGIPMATDIAFALGVLALVGKRIPVSLRIFLAALAISDDLGAVLVIALFYTSNIVWFDLLMGAGFLAILAAGNWAGVRNPYFYACFGIGGLWVSFFLSGVHPTLAGVLAAFTIPARTRIDSRRFLDRAKAYLSDFETYSDPSTPMLANKNQVQAMAQINEACEDAQTPLQILEHALHPWVAFLIMPLFALANAGVSLHMNITEALFQPAALGVILGLFFGKQLGIFGFSWILIKTGLASLPTQASFRQLYGIAVLGGIGFTMSLFVTGLAFQDPTLIDEAKIGILTASLCSGLFGIFYLRFLLPKTKVES